MHSRHEIGGIAQPAAEQSAGSTPHVELDPGPPSSEEDELFRPRCLSLDLEVGRQDGRIHAFGAVRADTGDRLVHSAGGLSEALLKLDELTDGASFVLGHNLIAFDLPHLAAAKPELRLLRLPAVGYAAPQSTRVSTPSLSPPRQALSGRRGSSEDASTIRNWMPDLRWRFSATSGEP